MAFAVGAVVVVGSSFMDSIPGNITVVAGKTSNLLVTPIACLFFFAIFMPRCRPAAVWVGWASGVTTAVLIAFSGPIFGFDPVTGYDPISFQWIAPSAVAVNITAGLLANRLFAAFERPQAA